MRRILATLALLMTLLAYAPMSQAHGGSSYQVVPLRLFVNDFSDATKPEAPLTFDPPAADTEPQEGTCLACANQPAMTYYFNSSVGMPRGTDIDTEDPGVFSIWLRTYQPAVGAGVPPLATKVSFELHLDNGTLLGAGNVEVTISDANPVNVSTTFKPTLRFLAAGAQFHWTVKITSAQDRYNPSAAPYGADPAHPYYVQVNAIRPLHNLTVALTRNEVGNAHVVEGKTALLNFTLHNRGAGDTFVYLNPGPLPAGAKATLLDPAQQPTGGVDVLEGQSFDMALKVDGLKAGTHIIYVEAVGIKGESARVYFQVDVTTPPPPTPTKENSPGFEVVLVGLALVLALRRRW